MVSDCSELRILSPVKIWHRSDGGVVGKLSWSEDLRWNSGARAPPLSERDFSEVRRWIVVKSGVELPLNAFFLCSKFQIDRTVGSSRIARRSWLPEIASARALPPLEVGHGLISAVIRLKLIA